MLFTKLILATFCVVVSALNEATFNARHCKIDLTCDEGGQIQGGIESSFKTFLGRPGKHGPMGPKGSKGEKGEDCQCFTQDNKEITELRKQLKNLNTRVCPQFKYYFPSATQTSDYIRVKVPMQRMPEVSVCAWITPLPGKMVENSFFSYAITGNDNSFLPWFDNGKFYFHLNGEKTHGVKLAIRQREHFCITFSRTGVDIYVNGSFHSYFSFRKIKPIAGGGALIIGQEQDSVLGGFHPSQAFSGSVENLMLWYRELREEEIYKMRMNPCDCPKDYDIAFSPEVVQLYGAVLAQPVNSCQIK